MTDFFLYGTLCHPPLLAAVLGRDVAADPALLPGFAVVQAERPFSATLISAPGQAAPGVRVPDLSPGDLARLEYHGHGFAREWQDLEIIADQPAVARVWVPQPGLQKGGQAWDLAAWQTLWGPTVTATAHNVMALFGTAAADGMRGRYAQMLVRGDSTVRAQTAAPAHLRHPMQPGDVAVTARRLPYAHFFAVEEYDLRFRRFDGTFSPVVNRAVFISGDAVTVLPYDPVRDVVLLIEQFRPGPFARGDTQPWSLEAIAGRIDPGETPEQAARREALEEAGLTLGALHAIGNYYPSPGAKAEFLYSFVAQADLPAGIEGVFGVEGEAEDIRGHRLSFDAFEQVLASGEVNNAPLLLTGLWLQRERARLRG